MKPNYTQTTDMLMDGSKGFVAPDAGSPKVAQGPVARYADTTQFATEFGDYRVRNNTENLCQSAEEYPIAEKMANGSSIYNQEAGHKY